MKARKLSDLDYHLGYWLRFVSNHVHHAFKNRLVNHNVTPAEWVVLRCLYDIGPCAQAKIVTSITIDKGAISRIIERLRKEKLLEKKVSKKDRRSTVIQLTEKGHKLVPVLTILADTNDKHFFSHLAKEESQQLLSTLKNIVKIHNMKNLPIN